MFLTGQLAPADIPPDTKDALVIAKQLGSADRMLSLAGKIRSQGLTINAQQSPTLVGAINQHYTSIEGQLV